MRRKSALQAARILGSLNGASESDGAGKHLLEVDQELLSEVGRTGNVLATVQRPLGSLQKGTANETLLPRSWKLADGVEGQLKRFSNGPCVPVVDVSLVAKEAPDGVPDSVRS